MMMYKEDDKHDKVQEDVVAFGVKTQGTNCFPAETNVFADSDRARWNLSAQKQNREFPLF